MSRLRSTTNRSTAVAVTGSILLAACAASSGDSAATSDPESLTGTCVSRVTQNVYDGPNQWGTITVQNTGAAALDGFAVQFQVPAGVHCTNDAVPSGARLSPLSGTGSSARTSSHECVFTWSSAVLAKGASTTFNYSTDGTSFSAATGVKVTSSSCTAGAGGGGGTSGDGGASTDGATNDGSTNDGATNDNDASQDAGAQVFVHPGAMVNGQQLAFLKDRISASAEPWTSALKAARSDWRASLSYSAKPPADTNGDVGCGSYSTPDIHCSDEKSDASAAYADAVIWALTGDERYAQKAIQILDAWSAVMKSHSLANAPLQAGWAGTVFARAGEIVRYTYGGWPAASVVRFAGMLKNAYVPYLTGGTPGGNGNWELSQADALIQIAVFLDDRSLFDTAVALWKRRVPGYIYMSTDGPKPVQVGSTWNGATQYFDGLCQETCRDLGHTQYGFAAMINAAETARIQGVDLYSLEAKRIIAGLELNAGYINSRATSSPACPLNAVSADPMWEVAYNEYANRLSMPLPNVQRLLGTIRPTWIDHHMDLETLTHAQVGSVGLR